MLFKEREIRLCLSAQVKKLLERKRKKKERRISGPISLSREEKWNLVNMGKGWL